MVKNLWEVEREVWEVKREVAHFFNLCLKLCGWGGGEGGGEGGGGFDVCLSVPLDFFHTWKVKRIAKVFYLFNFFYFIFSFFILVYFFFFLFIRLLIYIF